MTLPVDPGELKERIRRNYNRLCEPYYQIGEVFSPADYDWPGDKEGRALLAFVCQYALCGRAIPCMAQMMDALPEKTNRFGFFGAESGDILDEQQLSGHNWYLRGLLTYYEQFHEERALRLAASTVEHLYLPAVGRFSFYPVRRETRQGDVAGSRTDVMDGWLLSSDVGCAFMSVDGLSQYYAITGEPRVLALLEEMCGVLEGLDLLSLQAQTHCCLTAARGLVRLHRATGCERYLAAAKSIYELYIRAGMTATYQNYNWWGRGDTWTEPCAVVDSLMLALELFRIFGDDSYRKMAARIYHNGFAAMQVGNGGAGTTSTVGRTEPWLYTKMYEACFCCTMRLAEGLRTVRDNAGLLAAETGPVRRDEAGRYMGGDILYARVTCAPEAERFIDRSGEIEVDGLRLMPLVKYYNLPKEVTDTIRQQVLFDGAPELVM